MLVRGSSMIQTKRWVGYLYAFCLSCKVIVSPLPTTAVCALPFETPPPNTPLEDFLRYNFVQQKSSHNSYDKDVSVTEQLNLGIRSVELDIHVTKGQKDPLP